MPHPADRCREPYHEPLLTPQVRWFLLFSLLSTSCLALLMTVLPLFAETATGSALMAGLVTSTMMVMTVMVELGTPRLMAILGYRRTMEIGIALMGFPALLLLVSPGLVTILGVAAARGAGLALSIVAGTALAATLFPIHRRAEGLGVYGVAISIPSIALLPLGLWLTERYGFDLVFGSTALLAITGLAIGRRLPTIHPAQKSSHSILTELRDPSIARPTIIFSLSTLAMGILVTYLALAVPDDSRSIAAMGLFVQAACTTLARWGAGRLGDRIGSHRLLAPSMLLTATGMVCLVLTGQPVAVLAGMALFGIGLGGAQNASLSMMFERAQHDRVAQVSVIWNLAYDAGMGIGAIGFGVLSGMIGYSWGFAIVSALLFATVPMAWQDGVSHKTRVARPEP